MGRRKLQEPEQSGRESEERLGRRSRLEKEVRQRWLKRPRLPRVGLRKQKGWVLQSEPERREDCFHWLPNYRRPESLEQLDWLRSRCREVEEAPVVAGRHLGFLAAWRQRFLDCCERLHRRRCSPNSYAVHPAWHRTQHEQLLALGPGSFPCRVRRYNQRERLFFPKACRSG